MTGRGATLYSDSKKKGTEGKSQKAPNKFHASRTIENQHATCIDMTEVSLEATALETQGDITQTLHETPESRLSVSELVAMYSKTSRVARSVSADPDTRVGRDTGSTPTAKPFLTEEKRQELSKRASLIEHRLNILQDQEDLLTMSKMVSPPRTPEIHKENSLASPKENLKETSLQLTLEEGVGN